MSLGGTRAFGTCALWTRREGRCVKQHNFLAAFCVGTLGSPRRHHAVDTLMNIANFDPRQDVQVRLERVVSLLANLPLQDRDSVKPRGPSNHWARRRSYVLGAVCWGAGNRVFVTCDAAWIRATPPRNNLLWPRMPCYPAKRGIICIGWQQWVFVDPSGMAPFALDLLTVP